MTDYIVVFIVLFVVILDFIANLICMSKLKRLDDKIDRVFDKIGEEDDGPKFNLNFFNPKPRTNRAVRPTDKSREWLNARSTPAQKEVN